MKAILKYSLYRRPQPTNKVEAVGYLSVGSVIEVIKMVSGAPIESTQIWLYSNDGFYYWGGGADFTDEKVFADWNSFDEDIKKALLNSIVADEVYWFQKRVQGYIGCGWGYKNDDPARDLAVSVFVNKKTKAPLLDKVIRYKGIDVPIDIKEVDKFEHHIYNPNALGTISPDTDNPIQMGGSIAVMGSTGYGTRSMVLKNKQGKLCLMSCFHVLLKAFKNLRKYPTQLTDQVLTEFPATGCNPFGVNITKNLSVTEGRYNSFYDFGIVDISQSGRIRNAFNNNDYKGFYLIEELPNLIGSVVQMAGATSTIQSGKVLDVKNEVNVDGNQIFFNVIITEKISMPGDSGAPVVDANGKIVGIIIAGNSKDRSLVLPVAFLFTQLGYQLI